MDWKTVKWRVLSEEERRTCGEQPTRHSSARCEMRPDHEPGFHAGRTRGGYYKTWLHSWKPVDSSQPKV